MPLEVNYLNPFNRRFDFGVPLEDIFPPNDIHPRLKYLFEEAYKLYKCKGRNIDKIVKELQGSLETRLHLKHKIVNDIRYDIKTEKIEQAPGAYFWLIRHFLGLLPISLFPAYSRDIRFKWDKLCKKCRNFLQYYESEHEKKHELDYEFAEELNFMPFEHFLLLTILVNFIRKLSRKSENGRQISRRSLLFLTKYYYPSTCVRPYIPGHRDQKMFPMFFYLVLRWREIEKNCRIIGHPAYFLENNCLDYGTCQVSKIRDNWVQTSHFSPKVITIYKNMPYFCDNNNYLKDISCQTEQTNVIDRAIQNSQILYDKPKINTDLKHEKISEKVDGSLYPMPSMSSPIDNDSHFIEDNNPYNNTEFSFLSTDDSDNKVEWSEVVKETVGTVQKVEEYIYDDYDTFKKEEYNQISDANKNRDPLMNKLSKIGWTYTPENTAREESKEISPDQDEMNETYVKFEDVFDENGEYKINGDGANEGVKENGLNITFKKRYESRTSLFNHPGKLSKGTDEFEEGRSKKNFNLKRFKLKLDFLRVLTPKKVTCSTPSYDSIESKVKYKKIKNTKSNTL